MIIEFINWNKYNPRKDVTRTGWYRAETRIFDDIKYANFSMSDFGVLHFLLSLSAQNNGKIDAQKGQILFWSRGKISEKDLDTVINNLEQNGTICVTRTGDDVTLRYDTNDTNDTKRYETIRNDLAQQVERESFNDFESAWCIYPRKAGKEAALKSYLKKIKNQSDHDLLMKAIENYRQSTKGTEVKFLKYGSTFFNQWRDWVDYKESPSLISNSRIDQRTEIINDQLKRIEMGLL